MSTEELRKVIPTSHGLKFHDVIYRRASGIILAFVICKDGQRHKHYFGIVSAEDDPAQLLRIMQSGGKWYGRNRKGDILL